MDAALAVRSPTAVAAIAALSSSDDELGQVLALHRAAGVEEPERLTISAGDRRLLELHRRLTRRELEVAVTCRACKTVNAIQLSPETVPPDAPRSAWLEPGAGVRGPTYADLIGLPSEPDEAEAELLRRCTVGAPGRAAAPTDLELVDDSLTGPILLECVDCGEPIVLAADVERLVLVDLQRFAHEVEYEIHLVAGAYGWSLETIEGLPDERRRRLAHFVLDGR
jgi:hypothetical protein